MEGCAATATQMEGLSQSVPSTQSSLELASSPLRNIQQWIFLLKSFVMKSMNHPFLLLLPPVVTSVGWNKV